MTGVARILCVAASAILVAQGRLLTPPTQAPTTVAPADSQDVDAQIAALNSGMGDSEAALEAAEKDAGMKPDAKEIGEPSFTRHCTPAQKAKLDAHKDDAAKKTSAPAKAADKKMALLKTSPVKATKGGKAAALLKNFDVNTINERMQASDRKQLVENEEFLLGVMIMHQARGEWVYEQYVDALCNLAGDNPMLINLYKHYDAKKPMAPQLAALMDDERKHMAPTMAPPLDMDGGVKSLLASVMR